MKNNITWQRRLWEELMECEPILPPHGGSLLVVGDALPAEMVAAGDLLVARCDWRDQAVKGLAYDRVLLVANAMMPDAELALARAETMLRKDGKVVIVAARGWPWAVSGTIWSGGLRFSEWKKLLWAGGWKLEYTGTAGVGGNRFLRRIPGWGLVRVMVVKKSGKGGGLRVIEPKAFKREKLVYRGVS